MKQYQLKWIGTALQVAGCLLLALNVAASPWAFAIMLPGACCWFAVGWMTDDRPMLLLNGTFMAINVIGIVRWLA